MTYHCPYCDKNTLPPAVMPGNQRFCTKCGNYFHPNSAKPPKKMTYKEAITWWARYGDVEP